MTLTASNAGHGESSTLAVLIRNFQVLLSVKISWGLSESGSITCGGSTNNAITGQKPKGNYCSINFRRGLDCSIAAGFRHACAINFRRGLDCWGIMAGEKPKDSRVPPPTPFEMEAVICTGYLAADCVTHQGRDRPSMADAVSRLDGALAACMVQPASLSRSATRSSIREIKIESIQCLYNRCPAS
ncbi:hypothetical protein OIU84_017393 [Salix udensis]|uniref:Uncharacterized protein n=1 Tax=Salix udensis TaxID=889485 RepID=A0AAD6L401_9ROSI|nr:hypothetical protein OIU84_017393 [Salix udensis]